ncbi:DUF5949 family protein [Actinomadura sp. 6N118]|uniref:DUF5949 family protein n=1 Tax=Actinomadura sp. 6N118 TaxID=3375151 RepID=UPI0037996806
MLTLVCGISEGLTGLNPSSGFPFVHLIAVPYTPAGTRQARKLMASYLRVPGMVVGEVNRSPDLDRLPFSVDLVGVDRIVFTLEGHHFERAADPGWVQFARETGACCLEVVARPWPWESARRHDPRYTKLFLNDPQTRPRAGVIIPIPRAQS